MNRPDASAASVPAGPYAALEAMQSFCSGDADSGASPTRPSDAPALVFVVGDLHWALPQRWVVEVMRLPRLMRIPNAPEGLLGMVNLRGALVPVLGAGSLLGLSAGTGKETTVVVLRQGRQWVALAVDQILGLQRFAGLLRPEVPPSSLAPAARWLGVLGRHDGAAVGLVDWPALLLPSGGPRANAT